ncbi:MlaA family lipoprotein [Skermanella pratensis]|uniref:MlaA family lipoprotein n=1 Tax=Skermanella pratensis TaxID=2233999 RepID=UPI0013015447|nr:VacJ family lipoprotein [Skermanella pratensis]
MNLSGFPRFRGSVAAVALLVCGSVLSGCVLPPRDDPAALAAYQEANDPLEGFNRAIFGFNEGTDILLIRPVADIYRGILPNPVRNGIRNFLRNLRSPLTIANELLQGDWNGAEVATKRFLVNTTVGIGGLMDVAADHGLEYQAEDFGQTLAVWGVPEGPYLVLPLLGPSNFRDTTGIAAEAFGDPVNLWAANTDRDGIPIGRAIAGGIDTRSRLIEPIDDLRRNSLDYYASLRSLYRQNRINEISDGRSSIEEYPEFPEFPEFPEDEVPQVDNPDGTAKSSTP